MKLKKTILALTLLFSVGASVAVTHSIKDDSHRNIVAHAFDTQQNDTILSPGDTVSVISIEKVNGKNVCCIRFNNKKEYWVEYDVLCNVTGRTIKAGSHCIIPSNNTAEDVQKNTATENAQSEEVKNSAAKTTEKPADQPTKESPAAADTKEETADKNAVNATFPPKIKVITKATAKGKSISYNVADIYDVRTVYKDSVNKANCFFVMSKQEYRLYVYEVTAKDTALVATYPVCYAKYTQQKQRSGDRTTPECDMKGAFRIMQIQDYSGRTHDFGDGRGAIKSYGKWFMRLDLSKGTGCNASVRANTTIGIHGSTNNRESVPGNDSEGCIRLRDEDIIHLKTHYAQVGTKVVVKPYNTGRYAFEKKAIKQLGSRFFNAKQGYKKYPEPAAK